VGIFRMGIGVTAAGTTEDDTEASSELIGDGTQSEHVALARLAAAGGVLRATASLPVYFDPAPAFNSTKALLLNLTAGTEGPRSGSFLENPALSATVALEFFYQRAG